MSKDVEWIKGSQVRSLERQRVDDFTDELSDVLDVYCNMFEVPLTDGTTIYLNAGMVIDVRDEEEGALIIYPNQNYYSSETKSDTNIKINATCSGAGNTIVIDVDYEASIYDDIIRVPEGGDGITITLPDADDAFKDLVIINRSGGEIFVAPQDGQLIEGETSGIVNNGDSWTMRAVDGNWYLK